MITMQQCSFCKGRKIVEAIEELWFDGSWRLHKIGPGSLTFEIVEAWVKQDGARAPVRIVDTDCPRCGGRGEYEVEHVTCKIF